MGALESTDGGGAVRTAERQHCSPEHAARWLTDAAPARTSDRVVYPAARQDNFVVVPGRSQRATDRAARRSGAFRARKTRRGARQASRMIRHAGSPTERRKRDL